MCEDDENWRRENIGRLLNNAVRRFENRVLELMGDSGHPQTRTAHLSLTRNLDLAGTNLTELARRASMSKQAMSELVDQCAAFGLVARDVHQDDRRVRIISFTRSGLEWLNDFRVALAKAEDEMRAEIGPERMSILVEGLFSYTSRRSD